MRQENQVSRRLRDQVARALKVTAGRQLQGTLVDLVCQVSGEFPNVTLPVIRDLAVLVLAGMDKRHEVRIASIAYGLVPLDTLPPPRRDRGCADTQPS